jgi:small subunit ribosomal protein S2
MVDTMAVIAMRELLEAGVHFGHQTSRWNPKMRPFIFSERNGIHILDLRQTLEAAEKAYEIARDITIKGGTVLFVGTKKQGQAAIEEAAKRADMPYVNHRWLGGMLTNFQTIHKRILYMRELEHMETSGEMEGLPKKERIRLRRELVKLQAILGGVRDLLRPPDAVFIIDVNQEHIQVLSRTDASRGLRSPTQSSRMLHRSIPRPRSRDGGLHSKGRSGTSAVDRRRDDGCEKGADRDRWRHGKGC